MPEWLDSFSPSAASFLGSLVGVGGGLLAILAGALLNAVLNRRRDDRLRDLQGRAVAAALRGELGSLRVAVEHLLPIWENGHRRFSTQPNPPLQRVVKFSVDASDYARMPSPQTSLFEANAANLGLLGSTLAGIVSVVYGNYKTRSDEFSKKMMIDSHAVGDHYRQQIDWGGKFCTDCRNVEVFLLEYEMTGISDSLIQDMKRWHSIDEMDN